MRLKLFISIMFFSSMSHAAMLGYTNFKSSVTLTHGVAEISTMTGVAKITFTDGTTQISASSGGGGGGGSSKFEQNGSFVLNSATMNIVSPLTVTDSSSKALFSITNNLPGGSTSYLSNTTSATFNQSLTNLSSFTVFASSVGTTLASSSQTFNTTLTQLSSFTVLQSSIASTYPPIVVGFVQSYRLDPSSVTKQGPIVSSITLNAMYGAPTLTGTNFTGLPGAQVGSGVPAANIAVGSLGPSVLGSSITLSSMYGAPALTGTNFTSLPGAQVGSGVPAANIANGNLGALVKASSVAAGSFQAALSAGTNVTLTNTSDGVQISAAAGGGGGGGSLAVARSSAVLSQAISTINYTSDMNVSVVGGTVSVAVNGNVYTSFSTNSVSYLGISSTPWTSNGYLTSTTGLTLSSASVSYTGISTYTALTSSMAVAYTAVSTDALKITYSSTSVSYTGVSTYTALTSSISVSYTALSTDALKITYSSASVSYTGVSTYTALTSSISVAYLGISSLTSANNVLTISSASVSYLGISSGTSSPDSLTKSSAAISYVGISSLTSANNVLTLSSASVSYLGISSGTAAPDSITASSVAVSYLGKSSAPAQISLINPVVGTLPIANLTTNASSYLNWPSTGVIVAQSGITSTNTITGSTITATTTLVIPSGANIDVSNTGETGLDTTGNQLVSNDGTNIFVIAQATHSWTVSLSSGIGFYGSTMPVACAPPNSGITLTSIRATSLPTGTTVQFKLDYRAYGSEQNIGTSVFSAGFSTANATGLETTAFANSSMSSGNCLYMVYPDSDTTKGNPIAHKVNVNWVYTRQ